MFALVRRCGVNFATQQKILTRQNSVPLLNTSIVKCRSFQTTNTRFALPPLIGLAIRPVMKVAAILFGRTIRNWWKKLPPSRQQLILNKIRSRSQYIAAGATVCSGAAIFYYIEHIEEDPITKRKRFIICNDEQMQLIADMEFQNNVTEFRSEIIPPTNPIYKRVVRVANHILQSNLTLPQVKGKTWAVTLIDRPDVTNAYVLPNGKIIIFTGILNIASNDDQLAIVLSHEIAHALLQHSAEILSKSFYVDILLLVPLIMLWAVLPDVTALFSQWLSNRIADILIHLPFSRALETEADMVGMELAARACFDIREAPVLWGKMAEVNNNPKPLEWLSTHPNEDTRQWHLAQLIPAALDVRASCSCPRLPPVSMSQLYYTPKFDHTKVI